MPTGEGRGGGSRSGARSAQPAQRRRASLTHRGGRAPVYPPPPGRTAQEGPQRRPGGARSRPRPRRQGAAQEGPPGAPGGAQEAARGIGGWDGPRRATGARRTRQEAARGQGSPRAARTAQEAARGARKAPHRPRRGQGQEAHDPTGGSSRCQNRCQLCRYNQVLAPTGLLYLHNLQPRSERITPVVASPDGRTLPAAAHRPAPARLEGRSGGGPWTATRSRAAAG